MVGEPRYSEKRGLEFKSWEEYLRSVNDDLNILNQYAAKSFNLGTDDITQFCVKLRVFISSKKPYIYDTSIIKKVQKIQDTFFSNEFRKSLAAGKPNATKYQYQALNSLLTQLEKIQVCLSENDLIPKVVVVRQEEPDEDFRGVSI